MNTIQMIRRKVMVIGNKLHNKGLTLSQALKRAWLIVKYGIITKVKGVSFGRSQRALQHLTAYPAEDIIINLKRDAANLYDKNAVEVYAGVKNKGAVKIGYLPSPLARIISPLLDIEKDIKAVYRQIRGNYEHYMPLGIEIVLYV